MLIDGIQLVEGSTLSNAEIANGTSFPANSSTAELFYRSDLHKMYVYSGTAWDELGAAAGTTYTAGTGIQITNSVISSTVKSDGTTGHYLVQIGTGNGGFSGVPVGVAGTVLTSNGDASPTWEAPQVSGGTVTSVGFNGGSTGLTASGAPITSEGTISLGGTLNIAHGGTGATTAAGAQANILPAQSGHNGAALVTDGNGNLSWVVQAGSTYTASQGLQIDPSNPTNIISVVADSTGGAHFVQLSKGDGTLKNMSAGTAGYVLQSAGVGADPVWANVGGTVTNVEIVRDDTMGLYLTGGVDYDTPVNNVKHFTTTGSISLAGTLDVLHGGTGVSSVAAFNKLTVPSPISNSGKYLMSDGTNSVWNSPIPDQTGNAGKILTTSGSALAWTTASSGSVTDITFGVTSGMGLTLSGGTITSSGTVTLGGTLSPAHGGTGLTSLSAAINAGLPNQSGNTGKVLYTNGTSTYWDIASGSASAGGTVLSVDASGGTTGLTFTGGPITEVGTLTLSGTLAIASGGTGATTANGAVANLLPSQTGNSGKYLTTNGTTTSWATVAGGGSGSVSSVNADGGTTGLTFTGGPITSSGTLTLSGTIAIASGGTGATTAAAAITALLPSQTGNSGKVLTSNGTTASWTSASSGSVTSVDVSGGTTGLTFSGGPVTSSGTVTMTGTLGLANGGTGGTSAATARTAILPSQTSNNGKILVTNGTDVSWTVASSLGNIAAGNTGEVQFNNGGAMLSSANFTFDTATTALTLTTAGGPALHLRSGTSAQQAGFDIGRATAGEATMVLAGTAGDIFSGTAIGDLVIRNTVGALRLGYASTASTAAGLVFDTSGNITQGSTGYVAVKTAGTERLRVLANGAWSVGSTGTASGTAGQVLTSTGGTSAPQWTTSSTLSEAAQTVTAAATTTISYGSGPSVTLSMAANITTLSFTNVPATGTVGTFTLFITQDTTGSRTITWPASVRWAGGVTPILTTTASKVDIITLTTVDGGTNWFGMVAGQNF